MNRERGVANGTLTAVLRTAVAIGLFAAGIFAAGTVSAETVYVTDELRLGLHDRADTTDRPKQTLVSGAALEVLERAGRTLRVKTESGSEAWVKAGYTVSEEPARRRLALLQAASEQSEQKLAQAENRAQTAKQQAEMLQQQLQDAGFSDVDVDFADGGEAFAEQAQAQGALATAQEADVSDKIDHKTSHRSAASGLVDIRL